MSTKDYVAIAEIVGTMMGHMGVEYGEPARDEIYNTLYAPLVGYFIRENEHFNNLRFSFAVGTAESNYRLAARG